MTDALVAGIDLGTTFTAAAVAGPDHDVRQVPLGADRASIPSLIFLAEDGSYAFGDRAAELGKSAPHRLARNVKRRMGDPAPILLGGSPVPAHLLMARLLEWTLDAIERHEGARPDHTVLTHPANWSTYRAEYLEQAATSADLRGLELTTEPEAAAFRYAASGEIGDARTIAVYDLGGGTFDASVLRRHGTGFDVAGEPQGVESLGGIDFDEAILQWVLEMIDVDLYDLDHSDLGLQSEMLELRNRCTAAKIALSSQPSTTLDVEFADSRASLVLERQLLEARIRPLLDESIRALRRAVDNAGVTYDDLDTVLLVGGSSRIPLVTELLRAETGLPIADDLDPEGAVATGAAWLACRRFDAPPAPPETEAPPAPTPLRSYDELLESDRWSDAEIAATGLPVLDVPFVIVGGGLASFVVADLLSSSEIEGGSVTIVSDLDGPTGSFSRLAQTAGLGRDDPVPEYASWPVDDPRIGASGGLGDVLSWTWTADPPTIGAFTDAIVAECGRIGWQSMRLPARARAVRRRDEGGYVTVVRTGRDGVSATSLVRSRFVFLDLGRSRVAVHPLLQRLRVEHDDIRTIASVFEPHRNLIVEATARRASVAVLGDSVLAATVVASIAARGEVRVTQLRNDPSRVARSGTGVSIDDVTYDYVIDAVDRSSPADDHRLVRELVERGAVLTGDRVLAVTDDFEVSELRSRDGRLFAGGALVESGSHGLGALAILQGQALAVVDHLATLGFGTGVTVGRRAWGRLRS